MPTATADRDRLIAIIRERSFQRGTEVKLASGRSSSFYFNMKPTMLHPEGAHLIGRLIVESLRADKVAFVGGLEMGAVPLATAAASVSHELGVPVGAFFVRKQAKEHGTQSLVEGLAPGESLKGQRVAVLEDVTTTGGSAMKAVAALRKDGAEIVRVLTVVDRLEGAAETFKTAGLPFSALLTARDFD
jgi:orotate phosphoribosyltransferase